MAIPRHLHCLSLLFIIFLKIVGLSYGQSCLNTTDQKPLFVFGDSLFDAGNNPYFEENDDLPPSRYPYGLAYFTGATGRMSDGRLVPDFIGQFANLPLIPPIKEPGADFKYGANFASAGAAVEQKPPGRLRVMHLPEQVMEFQKLVEKFNAELGPEETRKLLGKAVFLFSFGGNDYLSFYTNFHNHGQRPPLNDQKHHVESVVANITAALKEINRLGGRKIAFQNVGPMGCLPSSLSRFHPPSGACIPELLYMPQLHNKLLYASLQHLAGPVSRGNIKFAVFEYYTALLERIQHPHKSGFEFGNIACCGNADDPHRSGNCGREGSVLCQFPSAYVFFDGGHTTQRTNFQLAQLMWDGKSPVTGPYNVKQLFEEN